MDEFLGAISAGEADVLRFGEILAQVVGGAGLDRLAILYHGFNGESHDRAGESFVFGFFTGDDGNGQVVAQEFLVEAVDRAGFGDGFVAGFMGGVAFLPEELGRAEEQARAHFPTHDVGPLVDQQGKIAVGMHPAGECGSDNRFGGGADYVRFGEFPGGDHFGFTVLAFHCFKAVVGDDRALGGEAFGVLRFFFKVGKRDQQREVGVLVAGGFEAAVEGELDEFPYAITPWLDHHAAAGFGVFCKIGGAHDLLVPFGEVFGAGRCDGCFFSGHDGGRIREDGGRETTGKFAEMVETCRRTVVLSGNPKKCEEILFWRFDSRRPNLLSPSNDHRKPVSMTEPENQQPLPSKQTSSVPLKKETVRVTLKAADAPRAVSLPTPAAATPVVSASPVVPPSGVATSTPTAPLKAMGAPTVRTAPAPTIPLKTMGAPTVRPAPAPTIPLKTTGAPTARPAPAPTIPLKTVGAPTGAVLLPKATVQLAPPTSPLQPPGIAPSQALSFRTVAEEEEEEEKPDTLSTVFSILGFVAALVILSFQILTSMTWLNAPDNPQPGLWSQVLNGDIPPPPVMDPLKPEGTPVIK